MCAGAANGSIDLVVSGSASPYTFEWSNGATTEDISGLAAGYYTVTVTDANGCTQTLTVQVSSPAPIVASATKVNPTCGINGSINLSVAGGVAPYSYLWSNGAVTQDISGLSPGWYTVTITDGNGCTTSLARKLWGAHPLKIRRISLTHASDNTCDGAIDIKILGGTQPFTYLWNNGATTQDLTNLCPGVYRVTVTDAQGCTAQKVFRVMYLKDVMPVRGIDPDDDDMTAAAVSLLNLYPNPTSHSVNLSMMFREEGTVTISIYNVLGKLMQQHELKQVESGAVITHEIILNQLPSGAYVVTVQQNGAIVHRKLQVTK